MGTGVLWFLTKVFQVPSVHGVSSENNEGMNYAKGCAVTLGHCFASPETYHVLGLLDDLHQGRVAVTWGEEGAVRDQLHSTAFPAPSLPFQPWLSPLSTGFHALHTERASTPDPWRTASQCAAQKSSTNSLGDCDACSKFRATGLDKQKRR